MKRLTDDAIIQARHWKCAKHIDGTEGIPIRVMPSEVGILVGVNDEWAYYEQEKLDTAERKEAIEEVLDVVLGDKKITRESVCLEADRLVDGEKDKDYGHPEQDMKRVGQLWGIILDRDAISPDTVCLMMIALKLSREVYKPKRDTRVDICGWAKCLDMVTEVGHE